MQITSEEVLLYPEDY